MYHIDDPGEMTEEERFREVAYILAKGFLRMKRRGVASMPEGAKGAVSGAKDPCKTGLQEHPDSIEK